MSESIYKRKNICKQTLYNALFNYLKFYNTTTTNNNINKT